MSVWSRGVHFYIFQSSYNVYFALPPRRARRLKAPAPGRFFFFSNFLFLPAPPPLGPGFRPPSRPAGKSAVVTDKSSFPRHSDFISLDVQLRIAHCELRIMHCALCIFSPPPRRRGSRRLPMKAQRIPANCADPSSALSSLLKSRRGSPSCRSFFRVRFIKSRRRDCKLQIANFIMHYALCIMHCTFASALCPLNSDLT